MGLCTSVLTRIDHLVSFWIFSVSVFIAGAATGSGFEDRNGGRTRDATGSGFDDRNEGRARRSEQRHREEDQKRQELLLLIVICI